MELDGASQKRRNLGQEVPPGGGDGHGDPDLISGLPDEVLGCIVTLLPTKDGARTQILSRRWRPLWRSAPLNLQVDWSLSTQDRKRFIFVPKILADHPGPARRFAVVGVRLRSRFAKIDGWLRSPALTGLEEIQYSYEVEDPGLAYPLPRSVLRFAPTLCVAEFSCCEFPNEIAPSLNFPHLKKLVLRSLIVSEDAVRNMLSGCPVLESLWLIGNVGVGRLHISSPTIRSIGFSVSGFWSRVQNPIKLHEVVIEDAPRLKRLLPLDRDKGPATIRVMHAPKLEILGMLSAGISKLELGTTVFQKMIALSLTTSMRTVKILALHSLGPDLNSVVDFLKCFPCVEKLYITSMLQKNMKNARRYNPLDPIECLELHLKKVVLKFYVGMRPDVDFAKFFILNAKVLKEMDFEASNYCNDKWMDNQHRRLQLDNKASPVARFAFGTGCDNFSQSIHSLPKADPFDWRNENFVRSARLFN